VPAITDVFFDLDHTLWDFERNSALAFQTVLKGHKVDVELNLFLKHYIPLNKSYWEKYRNEELTQAQLRYGRLKDTFDQLGYVINDATIDLLSEAYIMELPMNNHLYDGALEVLDYLQSEYRLHIITNGFQSVQDGKLKNSGIGNYFYTVTNSETAGVKKPNPLIFQKALELAQCQPQNALMIGDCLEADIQGALNVGMEAIFFNEFNIEVPSHVRQIVHLTELKAIL
jgi:YjjG family noncanonical pyrimidine nucleotidase